MNDIIVEVVSRMFIGFMIRSILGKTRDRINSLEQFIKAFSDIEMNNKFEIWNKKRDQYG